MVQTLLPILQLILAFGNVCILLFGFYKFASKPHNSLEERVNKLEVWKAMAEVSLQKGNKSFDEQDRTNEILIKSLIALIEFEIEYCTTERKTVSPSLQKAKDDLHDFLARR